MSAEPMFTLLYNVEKRQPGCVLLQAAYGATVYGTRLWNLFHPDTWNVDPTGMKLYRLTEAQIHIAAEKSARNG